MRVGSPPLINIISWPPCFVLCLMDAHSSRADWFIVRKKIQASSFELKEEEILRSDPARLQPAALGVRLELFDHPCRVSSHQPCFKRHKTRVSTIHERYTLNKHKPHLSFSICVTLAHKGLKLTCLLKEYIAFFSTPQHVKSKINEYSSICKG